MNEYSVVLWGKALRVRYPERFQDIVEKTFDIYSEYSGAPAAILLTIGEKSNGRITIDRTGIKNEQVHIELDAINLSACLIDAASTAWARAYETGAVLKAHAVSRAGTAIAIAGDDESGQAAIAEFLMDKGFEYLSDSMVAIDAAQKTLFGAPLSEAGAEIALNARDAGAASATTTIPRCGLFIFPQLVAGAQLEIQSLGTGALGQRLAQCLVNGASLPRDGLSIVRDLARSAPAITVQYNDVWQLFDLGDQIERLIGGASLDRREQQRTYSEPVAKSAPAPAAPSEAFDLEKILVPIADTPLKIAKPESRISERSQPTPKRGSAKLTIGMATYDDYDGVYFSIQALRLYHSEVLDEIEFIVVDNHPDGPCAEALKGLNGWVPNYRYVPEPSLTGTSQSRNLVFEEASGEFVLCMDCHVLIIPGALRRLLDYFKAHPRSSDLFQGPLLMDDLKALSTHFKPEWGGGMYGRWDMDPRGADPDAEPFEIPMQGLGLFTCRRHAWLGFNRDFRGFGGEEGYIHEKFRQYGHRTLCLPFLRWIHRFQRPMGIPYPAPWEDRIRNYLIGYRELGLPSDAMEAHFRDIAGADVVASIVSEFKSGVG